MREIQADTNAVSTERQELLDDISRMGGHLVELASVATARFPARQAGLEEEMPALQAEDESARPGDAADDQPTRVKGMVGSQEGGDGEARDDATERPGPKT